LQGAKTQPATQNPIKKFSFHSTTTDGRQTDDRFVSFRFFIKRTTTYTLYCVLFACDNDYTCVCEV